jgi:hypothetical protein
MRYIGLSLSQGAHGGVAAGSARLVPDAATMATHGLVSILKRR